MLTQKTLISLIILGFLVSPAAGDIKFDDPDNISFYTGLEFPENNQIYGLGEPTGSNSPVRLQDVAGEYLNRDSPTLAGPLATDGYNIKGFFDNSCGSNQAVKEIYSNGSVRCGPAGGNSGLPTVLDTNNSLNQNIDANGYQIGNLSAPVGSKSPLRQQDLGDYVNRTGDTLAGDIDMNGYEITNSAGGALRGFVTGYAGVLEQDTLLPSTNFLTYVHERGNVTQISGPSPDRGTLSRLFDNEMGWKRVEWNDVEQNEITIEISDINQDYIRTSYLRFQSGTADYIKLTAYDSQDNSWETVYEKTGNSKKSVIGQDSQYRFSKLRLTLDNKEQNSDIGITEFAATTERHNLDKTYVDRGGGNIYGSIDMQSNQISGLATPSSLQDAATKNYVDSNTHTLTESDVEDYIFDTGDNNGNLGLNGGNIVDNSGKITLDGDTEVSNGNLNLNSNNVTNTQCLGDQC